MALEDVHRGYRNYLGSRNRNLNDKKQMFAWIYERLVVCSSSIRVDKLTHKKVQKGYLGKNCKGTGNSMAHRRRYSLGPRTGGDISSSWSRTAQVTGRPLLHVAERVGPS